MKLKHIEIEATIEELENSPVLAELLAGLARPTGLQYDEAESLDEEGAEFPDIDGPNVPGVPTDGQPAVKAQLAGNPAAEYFRRFLAEASSWPKVAVHGIKPKGSKAGAP